MPRARPAGRHPNKSTNTSIEPSKISKSSLKSIHVEPEQSSESSDDEDGLEDASGSLSNEDTASNASETSIGMEEDIDVDAPRVAQWEPDDFEANSKSGDSDTSELEEDQPEEKVAGPSQVHLKSLQTDLSSLPLGALRKAQRTLALAQAVSDSEDDNEFSEGERSEGEPDAKGKQKDKPEWNTNRRDDLAKRSSKHAPQEVTSKRPVTRRRTVVEVKTPQPRDPRFLPLSGEFSDHKFQQQYGFLADIHSTELKTLRDNLKRAKKLLVSSPRDLREEREQEVGRLELALKRAESSVNKDKREMVEQKALASVTKEEREKRKQGKGGWWMKDADKKELLLRARYDALATAGGKGAVKKAIEKKQKKIGQKEKKSRPFAREQRPASGESSTFGKRAFSSTDGPSSSRQEKRRRIE